MADVPPRRGDPGNGQAGRSERVRDAALKVVAARPGLGQGELAQRLRDETGVPISSAITSIRGLEREGALTLQDEGYVLDPSSGDAGHGAASPAPDPPDEPSERVPAPVPDDPSTQPSAPSSSTPAPARAMVSPAPRMPPDEGEGSPEALLARGDDEAMGSFKEARGAAVQAYCARVCEVDAIPAAREAAFATFVESLRSGDAGEEADVDAVLLQSTREEAAERATTSPDALSSLAGGRPRLPGVVRALRPSPACEVMPSLLAARGGGLLSPGDLEKISRHIEGCSRCQATDARFKDAESAWAARVAQRPLDGVLEAVAAATAVSEERPAEHPAVQESGPVENPIEESVLDPGEADQAIVEDGPTDDATPDPHDEDEATGDALGSEPLAEGADSDAVTGEERPDHPEPAMGWWLDSSFEEASEEGPEPDPPGDEQPGSTLEWPALGGEGQGEATAEPAAGRAEVDEHDSRGDPVHAAESPAPAAIATSDEAEDGRRRRRWLPAMSRKLWIVLLVLAALALVAGVAVSLIAPSGDDAESTPQVEAPPPPEASPAPAPEAMAPPAPDRSSEASSRPQSSPEERGRPVDPRSVTVAVLSGTGIPGIAGRTAERLEARRFEIGTVDNAAEPVEDSVALYRPGKAREARAVGSRLGVSRLDQVDPANRALAGGAEVVVVVGSDLESG